MRTAFFRFTSGLLAAALTAFGLLPFLPIGELSVVKPHGGLAFLIVGAVFATFAITGRDPSEIFRRSGAKTKRYILFSGAAVAFGFAFGQIAFGRTPDRLSTIAISTALLALGVGLILGGKRY